MPSSLTFFITNVTATCVKLHNFRGLYVIRFFFIFLFEVGVMGIGKGFVCLTLCDSGLKPIV